MSNIIVCCDGTWNTPEQDAAGVPVPTNVVRIFNALADVDADGVEQEKYYHPGVGTDGSWWHKLAGGAAGVGLDKNIMSAYRWLGAHLRPDDRIFLFGFSRGAYTVRSLAGLITTCGLLDLTGLSEQETWKRVAIVYQKGYRKRKPREQWAGDWAFHRTGKPTEAVTIFFLGVWDTVGALGVPDDMSILNLLDDRKNYAFHDTTLSDQVEHARHAVAIDEMRASFSPTLWTQIHSRPTVKQLWFPGVHCDVGGGYPEKGLSDGALEWMIKEAGALELEFQPEMLRQVRPDFQDVLHSSRSGLFKFFRSQPRSIPSLVSTSNPSTVHQSALDRRNNPPITQVPYRPTFLLKVGEQKRLPIYAVNPWNETGLYLEAGAKYRLTASGEWMDRDIKCGPDGKRNSAFRMSEIAHMAGTLFGKAETMFKKLSGNEAADFRGTKREEAYHWFTLLGAVANGGNPEPDGTPQPHTIFPIGAGCTLEIDRPGYLCCFANDAWHFYDNNRGSVELKIERVA
jgi:hypothetical protein